MMHPNLASRKQQTFICTLFGVVILSLLHSTSTANPLAAPPQDSSTESQFDFLDFFGLGDGSDPNSGPARDTGSQSQQLILSEDCFAQRDEILRKQHVSQTHNESIPSNGNYSGSLQNTTMRAEMDSPTDLDAEHVPQCRQNGKYEPAQCQKTSDYCWCVNKFGQPLRNSAFDAKEPVACDLNVYETGGIESPVGRGGNNESRQDFLSLANSSAFERTQQQQGVKPNEATELKALQWETEKSTSALLQSDGDFKKRFGDLVAEPSLTLVPNECELSHLQAKNRASRFSRDEKDNIWIPECDKLNKKMYAERQCHGKSKVCWCVSQTTGLPLHTNQQLATQVDLNCSELRSSIEMSKTMTTTTTTLTKTRAQTSSFRSTSTCDLQKRADFMRSIVDQFRRQIGEYISLHPTNGTALAEANLQKIPSNTTDVLQWKFRLLDDDHNGRLEDREWCKFKMNFKLVDRAKEVARNGPTGEGNRTKAGFLWSPLTILRLYRHCWRDLLEFCGNGKLLVRDSMDLNRWMTCMELQEQPHQQWRRLEGSGRAAGGAQEKLGNLGDLLGAEELQANTREAAITRSKNRNPFAGILRSD